VAPTLVAVVIALTVAPILIVNALRILASERVVRYEVERNGFPADSFGLTTPERLELALTGLHSILPGGEGIALLERARLPDGSTAFDDRELRHMADVRSRLGAAFRMQLTALVILLGLAVALYRSPRWRSVVPRGLLLGSLATLGVALLAAPVLLLGFDRFFLHFHEVFFSGDSWRFSDTDTLLRVYPEVFWQDVARLGATLVVVQALLVGLAAWWWVRRLRAPAGAAA
jgi:integral membrane protein (TIGR01906 family)